MLDFSNAELTEVIVHSVGVNTDDIILSDAPLDIYDNLLNSLLREYFLGSFRYRGFYSFEHSSSLELNELYSYCSDFFKGNINFIEFSRNVANHLQHVSVYSNIKGGELYIATLPIWLLMMNLTRVLEFLRPKARSVFYTLAARLTD
ncbi:MAG TPA: hypothetical protein ENN49_09575 [Bacteroidales bacterium]|nr:hypothetical protein [Bacteroidales bacterium]